LGVIAVSCVALIAIPHWSAIIYIAPVVTILYVDLLGVIQFSGLSVNSVTYLGMVLSIGLIVDYTYHILLRYVESRGSNREERVNESLRTIGASVFVGGLSTLLGVVPLAFSSSHIIRIVFIIFIALVTLGLSKSLVVCLVLIA
jgi:Niemann-Pick C1 protein